jgi:dihydrolipoamide dehydrogenase
MYDVAIIGAGPAGYVAGIRASQLGLKACIIEKENVGGVCLNVGCIPSKSFIHQAGIFASQKALQQMGIRLDDGGFDFNKVVAISRSAVKTLVNGVERLLRKNKIKLIRGTAKIAAKNAIVIDDGTEVYAKNIVIATGSRPTQLPGFEFDEKQILSSNGMLKIQKLPENLLILGAGAIGCEFAYIMNSFGVDVQLVEMAEHILPFEDPDTVRVLAKTFADSGIKILTEARAISIGKSSKSVTVIVQGKGGSRRKLKAEMALCVFGRTPNTDNIGLENIGIKTEMGFIPIGDYYRTKAKDVFAVGDIIATPQLAHVASKEAEIAIEHIAGHRTLPKIDHDTIVSAVYCEPEIAGFGLQEKKAKDNKIPYKKTVIPFVGVGKAIAIGKTAGLVKILSDPRINEILGAHIVGHNATELIHEILLAKTAQLLPDDIVNMIHAHPTISEVVLEGMRAVKGQAIHV